MYALAEVEHMSVSKGALLHTTISFPSPCLPVDEGKRGCRLRHTCISADAMLHDMSWVLAYKYDTRRITCQPRAW